jgi:hypothetical protein
LLNQYLKIKKIDEGNFSKIKLMVDINTNQEWAMKKYNLSILKKKTKMGSKTGGLCINSITQPTTPIRQNKSTKKLRRGSP